MNALHGYVKKHPWLESTLRVAYWVSLAAIPILLLALLVGHVRPEDYDVRGSVRAIYGPLIAGDFGEYSWESVPSVVLTIALIAGVWILLGKLLMRLNRGKLTPLRLYLWMLAAAARLALLIYVCLPTFVE